MTYLVPRNPSHWSGRLALKCDEISLYVLAFAVMWIFVTLLAAADLRAFSVFVVLGVPIVAVVILFFWFVASKTVEISHPIGVFPTYAALSPAQQRSCLPLYLEAVQLLRTAHEEGVSLEDPLVLAATERVALMKRIHQAEIQGLVAKSDDIQLGREVLSKLEAESGPK